MFSDTMHYRLLNRHINKSDLKEVNMSTTLIYETVADDASKIKTFMAEKLPFYDHSWGYGYYELTGERDLSCNVKVLLKLTVRLQHKVQIIRLQFVVSVNEHCKYKKSNKDSPKVVTMVLNLDIDTVYTFEYQK